MNLLTWFEPVDLWTTSQAAQPTLAIGGNGQKNVPVSFAGIGMLSLATAVMNDETANEFNREA